MDVTKPSESQPAVTSSVARSDRISYDQFLNDALAGSWVKPAWFWQRPMQEIIDLLRQLDVI